jgi:hypothetical protein
MDDQMQMDVYTQLMKHRRLQGQGDLPMKRESSEVLTFIETMLLVSNRRGWIKPHIKCTPVAGV